MPNLESDLRGGRIFQVRVDVTAHTARWSSPVWSSRLPLRRILDGEPLILVEGGKPIGRNLKCQRLQLGEVLSEPRLQQVTRLADTQWAILESSGQISIILK